MLTGARLRILLRPMRIAPRSLVLLVMALSLAGCAARKEAQPGGSSSSREGKFIVTPANSLSGRVVRVNPNMRFVVIAFPVGQMPGLDQRMTVFRSGMKVGEVRITGPQRDDKIVADLMSGNAADGDEVRSQ